MRKVDSLNAEIETILHLFATIMRIAYQKILQLALVNTHTASACK